jgi:son of sevenless
MDSYEKLLALMNGHQNFSNYRKALGAARLPCLPYFGIFLRDLTFADDSLDDELENGYANFQKMCRMSGVLQDILRYQSEPYTFGSDPSLFHFLKNINPLSEDDLWEHSIQCEPSSDL